ncbi:MAG: adenylate/guanylate cyclase domain-containing protein [Pseudolabrys sp.]|nr:adenylate/guanylate cyclase domain-containing protein [Pseudolabrys sp.]
MTDAPAVLGGAPLGRAVDFGVWQALRGIGVREVRLTTGLIMFSYLLSHFANHALGNVSFETMQAALQYHLAWWQNPLVSALFYSAAATHFFLGLWALYQRRHFKYALAEITQLVLGLSIPLLLIIHFAGVRLPTTLYDRTPNYALALYAYWFSRPYVHWIQYVLMIVAWSHACIGLYFWLRMRRFFRRLGPLLFAGAVLLPPMAMLGVSHAAREVGRLAEQPAFRAQYIRPMSPTQRREIDDIIFNFPFGYFALLGLVFVARGVRTLRERKRGTVTLSYPDRQIRVPKGMSVLEGSLRYRVPHASVCGGRARCSTCRIRVVSDRSVLPRPSGRETHVLRRVGVADDSAVRLACQLRPTTDIAFIPILPPGLGVDFVRGHARSHIGEERYIVSMFIDMRGSTALAEQRLPFDTIFLINRFLDAVSQAVVTAGGQPNQFIGDGMLALFGLEVDPTTACRQALRAAALIAANVEHLNHQFAADLREPIQYGIGIHGGEVIIGDIGFRDRMVFTALGDAVNVAARLQDMTKSQNCKVIMSDEVRETAGIPAVDDVLSGTVVSIRGREKPMPVRTTADPTVLTGLLNLGSSQAK